MRKAGDKAKKEQGENEAADKEMNAKKAKQEEEASTAIQTTKNQSIKDKVAQQNAKFIAQSSTQTTALASKNDSKKPQKDWWMKFMNRM